MTVFFHAGADELHETVRGTPQSFSAVLDAFPQMRVVLAHLGGFRVWNDVAEKLVGRERLPRHRLHARASARRRLRRDRARARRRAACCSAATGRGPTRPPRSPGCARCRWPTGVIEAVLGGNAERLLGRVADPTSAREIRAKRRGRARHSLTLECERPPVASSPSGARRSTR